MALLQHASPGSETQLLGSWEHQVPTATSRSTITDPGRRRKGDAPPHHSLLLWSHGRAMVATLPCLAGYNLISVGKFTVLASKAEWPGSCHVGDKKPWRFKWTAPRFHYAIGFCALQLLKKKLLLVSNVIPTFC